MSVAAEISCYIKSFYTVFIYLDDICKNEHILNIQDSYLIKL